MQQDISSDFSVSRHKIRAHSFDYFHYISSDHLKMIVLHILDRPQSNLVLTTFLLRHQDKLK